MKYSLIALASLALLSSCSWYRDLERSLVEDDAKQARRDKSPVPREQYNQLLSKYEELSKKYQTLKENPSGSESTLVNELQKTQAESETVDVFAGQVPAGTINVPSDIDSQLSLYRRGVELKTSNSGEATKIFQQLETQAAGPIKARAKFQIGDMLLARGQFDLALQIFEDVINKNADSGIVLDALKGAVVASEKLGLPNKKDQYSSMLTDVFGSQGM